MLTPYSQIELSHTCNSNHKYEKWCTRNSKFLWIVHDTLASCSDFSISIQKEFTKFSEFIDRFMVGKLDWYFYAITKAYFCRFLEISV